ncbi:MAG: NAD(+)/NADH kinase [Clostridia bacterium]|nr:NAD(+)/NADH kinase [Clostridia bacterium]
MKFTINPSLSKDPGLVLSREVAKLLIDWGAQVWVDNKTLSFYRGLPVFSGPQGLCFQDADFAISVGGDGTFLSTAHLAVQYGVPVVGVNKGTVGFLTEIDPGELELLHRLFTKEYTVERRMLLNAKVRRGRGTPYTGFAVNDITVHRGTSPRLLNLEVASDGSFIHRFRADGMIVATPTGSTAYALSAGGPIIDPRSNCMEVVPIAAHTLVIRPTIFHSNARITVTPFLDQGRDATLMVDGGSGFLLLPGDVVHIRRDKTQVMVVRMKPDSFYEVVKSKLQEGEIT